MTVQPDTAIDLDALHDAIVASIAAQFPALRTVEDYREDRKQLTLPAVLVSLTDLEPDPDEDPGTEQLAAIARFEAQIVIGFRTANAKREIRKLAAALAHHIYGNRWGQPVEAARVTSIVQDDFSPELDRFEVWRVEWQQIVHIGTSIWDNDGVIPTEVLVSFAPDIGPDNEPSYTDILDATA
jgi:hypothetical protein